MEFIKIETLAQVEEAIKQIPDIVAVDTEFVKGDPRTTQLLTIIIADSERAWYFDYNECVTKGFKYLIRKCIESRAVIFLQDYNHCDTVILYKHGIDIRDKQVYNLIDMHHLIDENADHSLDARIKESYGDDYKTQFWNTYKNYEDAPEEEAIEYACKDAIYTFRLGVKDLKFVPTNLYNEVRLLSRSLLDTELRGLKVNTKLIKEEYSILEYRIRKCSEELRKEYNDYCEIWELKEWEKQLSQRKTDRGKLLVKRPYFNFDSDRQVSWLMYEALGIETIEKTKTGNPSTSISTLESLVANGAATKSILDYKELKSVFSTFIEGMLERTESDRIYPHFNVSGTTTGRLSHSNPNMGNLPKSGTIRNFFVPDSGMFIIGADYSQLEVVIEANLTKDPNLIKIITEGMSKHDITANGLKLERGQAKTLNFALQYGAGSGKVCKILGVSKSEGDRIFKEYWDLYSGVRDLKERTNEEIAKTGKITNLAGRTRHFPKPVNKWEMYKQQRQAYNFLIQGVAAECCNRAFYRFANWLKETGDGEALFSVHDEIVCQVWGNDAQLPYFCMSELTKCMEDVSKEFGFEFSLTAKAYGPLTCWSKE
jgi:DNA polymerase I